MRGRRKHILHGGRVRRRLPGQWWREAECHAIAPSGATTALRSAVAAAVVLLILLVAPAALGETAVINATVTGGQVVVTWSLPANEPRAAAVEPRHTATNIRWSTNPATVAATDPGEGSILACWLTGPADGKRDCTGGRDLGNNTTSFTITGLAPGTYYVQVQTYGLKYIARSDGLYHFNAYSNVVSVTVPPPDTTPPDTAITGGPSGSTTATSASFTFASTKSPSTFECRLDSGSFAACTSPQDYTGLAVGNHTFEVRAKDAAGNVDPTPASRTWTIQAPPPRERKTPPSLNIPDVPASNGTAQCQQLRGMLARAVIQARQLNDVMAKLTNLSEAEFKKDAAIIAKLQKLLDQAAAVTEGWCNRATDGGYGGLPPDNGTPGCKKARDHILYVNAELKKAYRNQAFNTLKDSPRADQLRRRIDQLITDLERSFPRARKACATK